MAFSHRLGIKPIFALSKFAEAFLQSLAQGVWYKHTRAECVVGRGVELVQQFAQALAVIQSGGQIGQRLCSVEARVLKAVSARAEHGKLQQIGRLTWRVELHGKVDDRDFDGLPRETPMGRPSLAPAARPPARDRRKALAGATGAFHVCWVRCEERLVADERTAGVLDKRLGERVRARRLEISMSQEHLAERLGVTFQQVQKYEKGVNRIAAGRLLDIAHALKISPGQMLEGLGPAPKRANASDGFIEALGKPEVAELVRLFGSIRSQAVRRRVLELVRTMAAES